MYISIVKIIVVILLFHFQFVCSEKDKDLSCVKNYLGNIFNKNFISLKNFSKKLQHHFQVPLRVLEKRKNQLQQKVSNLYKKVTALSAEEAIDFTDDVQHQGQRTLIARDNNLRSFVLEVDPLKIAPEVIKNDGYIAKAHTVQTIDGYKLVLHRILSQTGFQKKIVLLHHGLLGSSDDWLILGPKNALPYLMSNAGYDVWLANARGNRYSKAHYTKSSESSSYKYWNFSWHEIGYYDLRATITYIRNVTKESAQIDFVGYSMGATALLVLLSTLPQFNEVLRSAILLAPLSIMYSSRGLIRYLADLIEEKGLNAIDFLGKYELLKKEPYPNFIVNRFCVGPKELCLNPLLLLSNGGKDITDDNLKKNVLKYVPAGGSTKTIIHYCQLLKSGHFQMFDYGMSENSRIYGAAWPPSYRLLDVTVPLAVFTAADDQLSTTSDALSLLPNLPFALQHHIIKQRDFSHTDFVFSKNATKLVYDHVLKILNTVVVKYRKSRSEFKRKGKEMLRVVVH